MAAPALEAWTAWLSQPTGISVPYFAQNMSVGAALAAAAAAAASAAFLVKHTGTAPSPTASLPAPALQPTYEQLASLVAEEDVDLPAALLNLDAFDHNVRTLASLVAPHGKTIRLATKSVRVPYLIARCFELEPETFKGLMCYSVQEALFLATHAETEHLDDFMVAYPTVQRKDVAAAYALGAVHNKRIALMIDTAAHVDILDAMWEEVLQVSRPRPEPAPKLCVCIDIDMSFRPLGGLLHIGAHRSAVRSLEDVAALHTKIRNSRNLQLTSLMGYEAQISGVPDNNPFTALLNPAIRLLQHLSLAPVRRQRQLIAAHLAANGVELDFFNGGGTGSAALSAADPALTEVACGSGLVQSTIFDYFSANRCVPALCFGLRITRSCEPGLICCQSGGFIASGEVSADKTPRPYLPATVSPLPNEGYGEVQTPLATPHDSLSIGDPVFFRPAKSGEIAERFHSYVIYRLPPDNVNERTSSPLTRCASVLTYRGLGQTFY